MDFKVCGTEKGVTAMQMDIKIDGLTEDILRKALEQAREGRIFIIGKLRETISAPRPDISHICSAYYNGKSKRGSGKKCYRVGR